jgi:hypothetical protein
MKPLTITPNNNNNNNSQEICDKELAMLTIEAGDFSEMQLSLSQASVSHIS